MNATTTEPVSARELAKRLHAMYQVANLEPDHPIARAVIELRAQAGVIDGLQATSRAAGQAIRDAQAQIGRLTTERERLVSKLDDVLSWCFSVTACADPQCDMCRVTDGARDLLEELRR